MALQPIFCAVLKCAENEEYHECVSICGDECNGPDLCPVDCEISGCECAEGFKRQDDKCIEQEECPSDEDEKAYC